MAGDINIAKQVCREYCMSEGFCVTIEPCDYIYTGGEEAGFRIGIINYPRFPTTESQLEHHATYLAGILILKCCQHSYTIVGPNQSQWVSNRNYEDKK